MRFLLLVVVVVVSVQVLRRLRVSAARSHVVTLPAMGSAASASTQAAA
jgi:hypothetical protein